MKKRVVSLLLCLIMALSLIPTVAFAAEPVAEGPQSMEQLDTLAGDPQATALFPSPLKLGWMYANITNDSGTLKVSNASSDKDFSKNVTVTLERLFSMETMDKDKYYIGMPAYDESNKVTVTAKGDYYIAYVAFCCQGSYSYVFINPYDCTAPQKLYADNGSNVKSVSFTLKQLRDMQKQAHEEYCWLMVMVKPIEETPTPDPTGTLTVTKNVMAPVGVTVPDNFTFTIKKDDTVIDANFAVPANGSKSLTNLTLGNYTVTENASTIPAGYSLATKYGGDENATSATANVTANGATVTVTNTYAMIEGSDVVAPASLTIKKVDATADTKLLPGAKFKLLDTTDSNKYYIETTDTNGSLTFNNIPEGIYTLMETEAPANYIKSNTTWTVKVEKTGDPQYVFNAQTNAYDKHYNSTVSVSKKVGNELAPETLGANNTLTVENTPKNATTVKINITKNVKVTGNTQPTTMPAFTFNINVGTKTLKAVSLTPVKQADGTWKVSQDVDVVVPYDDFNASGEATLTISEVDGKLANWKYDGTKYTLTIKQQGEIAPPVSTSATLPAVPVYSFTNEYTYTYTPTTRPSNPIRRQQPTTTTTKPVQSVKTGDMGIALYAVTSLLSLSGTALLIKKRKDEK